MLPTLPSQPSKDKGYKPQLDSLRALAVLLVVASHWVEYNDLYFFKGRTGVLLFFILSGYLITGILLDCKARAQHQLPLLLHAWKSFFKRRMLRIFPLYYAAILLMFLLGFEDVRQHFWWHIAYLSNLLIALQDNWYSNVSHFWSLAIEEQFYIIWPVIVLFMPLRYLKPVLISFLVGAPLFRLLLLLTIGDQAAVWVLPFSVVDSLGMGALFAYWQHRLHNSLQTLLKWSLWLSGTGLALAVFFQLIFMTEANAPFIEITGTVLYDSIIVLSLSAPILYTALHTKGWGISLLSYPPLVYLGKISYGIYIFHIPVKEISRKLAAYLGLSQDYYDLSQTELVLIWSVLTLVLSMLSWHLLENRLNRLKHHFPYFPKQTTAQPQPTPAAMA